VAPAIFVAGGVVRTGKKAGDKIAGATTGILLRFAVSSELRILFASLAERQMD